MFKTRDFLPVIITALIVLVMAIVGLAKSNACAGDWSCWLIDPFKIFLDGMNYRTMHRSCWIWRSKAEG